MLGAAEQTATIHLGPALPQTSVRPTRDLIGGPPASLSGLAPGGVCRAAPVARDAGGLLLHRFTLACSRTRRFEEIRLREPPAGFRRSLPSSAVCSLLHFPSGHPAWALPSTLPCGVRTFLCVQRSPGGLTPQCYLQPQPVHPGRCTSAGRHLPHSHIGFADRACRARLPPMTPPVPPRTIPIAARRST